MFILKLCSAMVIILLAPSARHWLPRYFLRGELWEFLNGRSGRHMVTNYTHNLAESYGHVFMHAEMILICDLSIRKGSRRLKA
jgi:hypothetical protein